MENNREIDTQNYKVIEVDTEIRHSGRRRTVEKNFFLYSNAYNLHKTAKNIWKFCFLSSKAMF